MHKPQALKLSIYSPCHQSWDDMKVAGQGRFCSECQKIVIDFTSWSDTALYQFFSKPVSNVCGRFYAQQLNRPINIPHQPHSRLYRLTIAMGLTLLFAQTLALLAQNRPPKIQWHNIAADTAAISPLNIVGDTVTVINPDSMGWIQGKVVDEKREPLLSAILLLYQNTVLKGGTLLIMTATMLSSPLNQESMICW